MNESTAVRVEADLIIKDAGELLTCAWDGSTSQPHPDLGKIPGGAVAVREGRVVWVGETRALTDAVRPVPGGQTLDVDGRLVMPGLVECHAHLAWAGDRADEFQMRAAGETYEDEFSAGEGGIMSTVRATRAASDEVLRALARKRLDRFLRYGVTTVEAKSGYGLSLAHEMRLLEVYRDVALAHAVDVVPTLLAAHVVPAEYSDRPDDYVKLVVRKVIPTAAKRKLARFCDAFCEVGAYSVQQCRRVLEAGIEHGLLPKLHADQLSYTGATELAAQLGAVSADHLDHISDAGIAALAAAPGHRAPVAVLLPGASFFLGAGGYAPARRLLDAGARVALSTDFNPGSSPTQNLWLMGTMGCSQLSMTAEEVIRALTIEAAAALALDDQIGSLEVGKKADILVLDYARDVEIPYRYGMNPVWRVFKDGKLVVRRDSPGQG